MFGLSPLLTRALIVLAIAGVGAFAGGRAVRALDNSRYASLQAEFATYRANTESAHVRALTGLNAALQDQARQRNVTEARNAQLQGSLESVQADAAAAHTDLEFARRLLAFATQVAGARPGGVDVPQAGSAGKSDDSPNTPGHRSAADLLGDVAGAAAECRDAIQRFAALQLSLSPNVTVE